MQYYQYYVRLSVHHTLVLSQIYERRIKRLSPPGSVHILVKFVGELPEQVV